MPGFFEQAKKALELRNQMKRIQREIENTTVDYSNGGVSVTMSGDFQIRALSIDNEELLAPAKKDKLQRTLLENFNKAVKKAKDEGEKRMKEASKGMNLGGLLGGM